ncbi:hypothetical protein SAPIO_CDS7409 [Scedosporium apiospermum]|uniref:Glutamine-dependent NAD(+) synthetase n=1 Tax=Pseudallescheria apiosperma TaxID=563466 RepID=A0A084G1U7_PSEDA|nr:uncharacterized protein SAPIO_CDS7409 [Scedosporium apiospermum]KEZ41309.1 hypothetical protein SAPIO_CDS7409 [Scedosporium apiospermum]
MQTEPYYLESIIERITGQHTVPFGDAILSTLDTAIGCETCEELFTPSNPSTYMGLNGCEIILNSSASHAELRKLRTRLDLIANSTRKLGGIYVYANATGVDGEARMMFDGSSMILVNGRVLEQGSQFSLNPVEVTVATIDIEQVRSFRSSISRNVQGAAQPDYPRVEFPIRLSRPADEVYFSDVLKMSKDKELRILDPMEEIWLSTSVYLWQCLDSSTVALFVYGMARLVMHSIAAGETTTLSDLRRVTGIKDFSPKKPEEIVNLLLTTCYMGTVNSSEDTKSRAKKLSEKLGGHHLDISIDNAVGAHNDLIKTALNFTPRYSVHGGSRAENLALQNIQARNRMVVQYSLAQLATTARNLPRAGTPLLVLSSGNVDENLRGYYTKYDASSGDLAPLGSISKTDARRFQSWARDEWDLPIMTDFLEATPTAELLPLEAGVQDDESENEMGMTYEAINRHKATIITPSIHLSGYNPDDNRHDLRPFLYVVDFPWQFNKIKAHVEKLEARLQKRA